MLDRRTESTTCRTIGSSLSPRSNSNAVSANNSATTTSTATQNASASSSTSDGKPSLAKKVRMFNYKWNFIVKIEFQNLTSLMPQHIRQ